MFCSTLPHAALPQLVTLKATSARVVLTARATTSAVSLAAATGATAPTELQLPRCVSLSNVCTATCPAEDAFLVPPSRPSQVYQLCAIQDADIRQLLQEAPVLPTFSNETGKAKFCCCYCCFCVPRVLLLLPHAVVLLELVWPLLLALRQSRSSCGC